MKKFLFLSVLYLLSYEIQAQSQFPSLTALRTFINTYIRNNAVESFQQLRLNQALNGLVDYAGGANTYVNGLDTIVKVDDSTFKYRLNGFFYYINIKGVYDTRRKVDTIYALNDTTLNFTINGTSRQAIIKGIGAIGNTLTSVGTGYPVGFTGTNNIRSLSKGYGILIDTLSGNLTVTADTAVLKNTTNSIVGKVDSIWSVNDTLFRFLLKGNTYDIVVKGKTGSGNISWNMGISLNTDLTNYIKSVQQGYGMSLVDSPKYVTFKVDTSVLFPVVRTMDKVGITGLDQDVTVSGNTGVVSATISPLAVTNGKFRNSVGLSVVGRSANTTGSVADIQGTVNGQVLRVSSNSLSFGTLDSTSAPDLHSQGYYDGRYSRSNVLTTKVKNAGTGVEMSYISVDTLKIKTIKASGLNSITRNADSSITIANNGISELSQDVTTGVPVLGVSAATISNNAVTNAKFRTSAAASVVGNSTAATSNVADITSTATGQVLKRTGTTLGWGTLDSTNVPDLHSEGYFNTKYLKTPQLTTYLKQVGTGVELGYQQVDSFKLKRIQAGTGVTITRNADSSLTLSAPTTTGITSMSGDATSTGTAPAVVTIQPNVISNNKFRKSAAYTVVGNNTTLTDTTRDLTAGDSTVLRRIGTTFGFGKLDSAQIPILHSEGYYNTKYTLLTGVDDRIKNIGTGTELSFNRNDSAIIKRVQAGSLISISRNADSSITITGTGDGVGATGLSGDVLTSGTLPTLTTTIQPNAVTSAKFRQSAAYSVVGNGTSATATVTDVAATDSTVLRRLGTSFGFAKLDSVLVGGLHSQGYYDGRYTLTTGVDDRVKNIGTGVELSFNRNDSAIIKRVQAGSLISITRNTDSSITITGTGDGIGIQSLSGDVSATGTNPAVVAIGTNKVQNSQIRKSAAYSIMGNATSALADITDISSTADFQVLKRSGTSLVWGTLDSNNVPTLKSQGYYDGRYTLLTGVDDRIKTTGTGFNLYYPRNDSAIVKNINAGTNLSITRNADSSLTINATGDGVGATGLSGDVTTSGTLPTLTATIAGNAVNSAKIIDNTITNADLVNAPALSVKANATNASAALQDISPTADFQVLKRSGTSLVWGTLDSTNVPTLRSQGYYDGRYDALNSTKNFIKNAGTGTELGFLQVDTFKVKRVQAGTGISITRNTDSSLTITNTVSASGIQSLGGEVTATGTNPALVTINNGAITNTKLSANAVGDANIRKSTALSVIGNNSGALRDVADITSSADNQVLKRTAGALVWGTLDSLNIPTLRSQAYYDGRYDPLNATKNFIKNSGLGTELGYLQTDTFKVKRVQAGTGISITRNIDSSLTIANTAASGIQSITGDIVTTGTNPATAVIQTDAVATNDIQNAAVTGVKFRSSAALSVVGNPTNASASVQDITASVDNYVLKRSGTSLVFGQLDSLSVPNLRSVGFYDGRYDALNSTKNYIKNGGAGVELGYLQVDTFKVKRIQAGTGVTIARNTDSSLSISATAPNPQIQLNGDVTGGPMVSPILTTIAQNSVSDGKLRTSNPYSVIGRSASTGGTVADISATTNGQVLRLNGTTLGFGTIDSNSITNLSIGTSKMADYSITGAKFRQSAPASVVGRYSNTQGDVYDIQATQDYQVLNRKNSILVWSTLDSNNVPGLHSEGYYNGVFAKVGGANTQIQFNNNGVLGGSANYIYEKDSARTTFKGNVPLALLRDTNTVYARQTSVQSRKLVVNDTANTTDNGYITQIYKDSTNRALYVNGNIRLDNTQRGTASDSLFLLKGTDSVLRQSAVKTINGVSILGSGNIVTAASAGSAGGSDGNLQFNSLGTLAGASNLNLTTNPANSSYKDLSFTFGSIYYYNGSTNSWTTDFPSTVPNLHLVMNSSNGKIYYYNDINTQGTYTPTVTAGTNVTTAPTALTCYYSRIGNHVTVWGGVTIQTNSINLNTDVFISLPPLTICTPTISNVQQLVGTASTQYNNTMVTIIGDATTGTVRANMKWIAPNISPNVSRQYYFQFTYLFTETCN